ncbi:MAG: EF-P lysine aminoacylase EpmA [Spongiibacteraceae bacterium]
MNNPPWQPAASIETLQQRAALLRRVRQFFAERDVLEVETPALARYSVTDPAMEVLSTDNPMGHPNGERYYLQTSPEYAMKRLLVAGSGAIYQLGKAFRKGERGSRHNPEFSMLEWYRPGFDHLQLMAEVEALISQVFFSTQSLVTAEPFASSPFEKISYRDLFQQYLAIDPHRLDCAHLQAIARAKLDVQMQSDNRDDWLNLLLAELIEPHLGHTVPVFVYDYPASQAALAKVVCDQHGNWVAQRFELYAKGIELANGYFELTDAQEQSQRFQQNQQSRRQQQLADIESDQFLAAALAEGLPSCAGVALGFDRLVMLSLGKNTIDEVLAFPVDRA